jgi:hypothetical protein
MENLYYVVDKELQQDDLFEYTTGNKTITVYDVDTQTMQIVVVCIIESLNYKVTENEIETWLENNDYEDDYNLIRL